MKWWRKHELCNVNSLGPYEQIILQKICYKETGRMLSRKGADNGKESIQIYSEVGIRNRLKFFLLDQVVD